MLIFVYGTLKRGFRNHHLLDGARFVEEAKTAPYWMLASAGSFPVLFRGRACVTGEVWEINRATLTHLDYLESNGFMYHRHRIYVSTSSGKTLRVWAYVGADDFWLSRLSTQRLDVGEDGAYTW